MGETVPLGVRGYDDDPVGYGGGGAPFHDNHDEMDLGGSGMYGGGGPFYDDYREMGLGGGGMYGGGDLYGGDMYGGGGGMDPYASMADEDLLDPMARYADFR